MRDADAARFAGARRSAGYAEAMERTRPCRASEELTSLIGRVVCVLLVFAVGLRTGRGVALWLVVGSACAWYLHDIRRRLAPVERWLAIITRHRSRGLVLHTAGERPHWYPATRRARKEAEPGAIGVAFFRRDVIIAFERLDA